MVACTPWLQVRFPNGESWDKRLNRSVSLQPSASQVNEITREWIQNWLLVVANIKKEEDEAPCFLSFYSEQQFARLTCTYSKGPKTFEVQKEVRHKDLHGEALNFKNLSYKNIPEMKHGTFAAELSIKSKSCRPSDFCVEYLFWWPPYFGAMQR